MSKPKRITDGWYIFECNDRGSMRYTMGKREVVRVLEDEVLITGNHIWQPLKRFKKDGTFIERIDLYKRKPKPSNRDLFIFGELLQLQFARRGVN